MDFFELEIKLKAHLNSNKIKLNEEPFTIEKEQGYGLKSLAIDISKEINQDLVNVIEILERLRIRSISNVASILNYKSNNICSIKVHQPKQHTDIIIAVEDISLETGALFRKRISEILHIETTMLKIIFKGKLINDSERLQKLGIKNNSKVMILNLTDSECQTQMVSSYLNEGRKMAEYLSKRAIDGKFKSSSMDLEITNQSGEVLNLTNEQKSYITFGLAMHKQATNFISKGHYQIALLYCLEADDAFVKSHYCDQVDNVAILQLDIVWCYFCLQNFDDISESKQRLEICEKRMSRCYGEGNERIQRIREKTTFEGVPESVHIFRLYLMKGILAYYENSNTESIGHLKKALDLYNSLSVPDELIVEVMKLGFSREQAIDGLRVNKNVNIAVEYILRRIEDQKQLEDKREVSARESIIVKRLGTTKNDSRIDLPTLRRLINESHMAPSLCLAAIRRTNNSYSVALEMIFSEEEMLWKDVALARHRGEVHDGDISYEAVLREKEAISRIIGLVDRKKVEVKRCLRQSDGNVDRAIEVLLDKNFSVAPPTSHSARSSPEDQSDSAKMEEAIYEHIGEGSSTGTDGTYANPDLFNEISAFNKFAAILNLETISSINEHLKWD